MTPALSCSALGAYPPFPEFVALAGRHGFHAIEFSIDWAIDLAKHTSWAGVRALLTESRVTAGCMYLPVDFRLPETEYRAAFAELANKVNAASQIGCERTATWIPSSTDEDPAEFRKLAVKRVRQVAARLADSDMRLGVEWVGPKTKWTGPTAMGKNPFIHTLAGMLELIDEIDSPEGNVGLLVDSFHWFTAHHTASDLLALTNDQVVHVHINDAPDKPADEQIDNERLLPGDGIIDLKTFLSCLKKIGYDGILAVESFNNSPTTLEEDAARTAAACRKVMALID